MASRSLREEEIEEHLYDYEASVDGFEGDDDSIADPDFFPDLELPFEEQTEETVDRRRKRLKAWISTELLRT